MAKKQLVVCCKADKRCGFCLHSEPHEVDEHVVNAVETIRCTECCECYLYGPDTIRKVRCTGVKGEK